MALLFALSCLLVLGVLLQILGNDLVWDDEYLIENAPSLGASGSLWDHVAKPFWYNVDIAEKTTRDYWRPLTSLMLWLTAFFFGKWPPAFHGLSILVALGAAAAFYLLARAAHPRGGRLPAAGIALVFLAHPLAAEVVCMAANISDHLAFAFLALATWLLMRRFRDGTGWVVAAASAMVLLACCSKELGLIGAAAPLAAWLLVRARGAIVPPRSLGVPWPWIGCVLAAGVYLAARHLVFMAAGEESAGIPGYGFYAKALFFGLGQAVSRIVAPVPTGAHVHVDTSAAAPLVLSLLVVLALVAASIVAIHRRRAPGLPAVGLALALALLLPSLMAVDPYGDALRFPVRYFHLPLAGVLLAALPSIENTWSRGARLALPLAALLLALLSFVRVAEWRDNVAFFGAEARYHPDSLLDQHNLARALVYARAYDHAAEVIERMKGMPGGDDPGFRNSLVNEKATIALLRDGDVEGASEMLREALVEKPENLANIVDLASIRVLANRPDQAVVILRHALEAPWFEAHGRRTILRLLQRYEALAAEEEERRGARSP